MKDLHILPKFRDVWSYLYVEHCRIDQEGKAIAIRDARGRVPIPCANLALLMLGPGTSITHAAISALADSGCLVFWCGEEGLRLYAYGQGKTRNADNLMHQARLWASPSLRLQVVMRLYQMRFDEPLDGTLSLPQIRGKEGIRIREAYARESRETGVPWRGRSYKRESWPKADPVNRALSTANSCLNGICQAAILALGLSPALGFIHTGKMLSFVYDIADLYKTKVSIPLAFRIVATSTETLESRVRKACREIFRGDHLLKKIVYDIHDVLELKPKAGRNSSFNFDVDEALPGPLWGQGSVSGGRNYCHETNKEG
ncbi:MAG: type I-E CRISPR-associated endonuclease Cas1 [candidate division Zixibacteria bacterium]|nr:type I-E CRISPR-associated endonuclease Cas1 [candidate division Zixibacteria bacterium]